MADPMTVQAQEGGECPRGGEASADDLTQGNFRSESTSRRRRDAFARVPWSLRQCGVALVLTAVLWGVVRLQGRLPGDPASSFRVGLSLLLWLSCFVLMSIFPLGMAKGHGVLRALSVRRIFKEFALAIPLAFLVILLHVLIGWVLVRVYDGPIQSESSLTPSWNAPNEPLLYLIVIPIFTLGPFAEELFFRGFLYNALCQWLVWPAAIFAQALVFALIHYRTTYTGSVQIGLVFLMGVMLAGVYEWRKTLWAPVMLHSFYNFLLMCPVLLLLILNTHSPARTWEEAAEPPAWLGRGFLPIERQENGEAQRLYAINTWGTRGARLWKQEIRAMEAVRAWFPEDRAACAQARGGVAMIFQVYLNDPMRAVIHGDWVLSEYPDQPESCAQALLTIARAYATLDDLPKSRAAYGEVLRCYPSFDWVKEQAEQGLRELDGR